MKLPVNTVKKFFHIRFGQRYFFTTRGPLKKDICPKRINGKISLLSCYW